MEELHKLDIANESKEVVSQKTDLETNSNTFDTDMNEEILLKATVCGRDSLRVRILWTCVVFCAHACMALMNGALGPAFLDLLHLIDARVEQGSFLFTSHAVGGMVGGGASAWCYTKFTKEKVLAVSLLICACLNSLIPFCPTLWLMCVVVALRGVAMYLCFTGCALVCIEAWRDHEGSPIMQALHCAYSAGGVIAPFIMSNFLMEETESLGADQLEMTGNVTTAKDFFITTKAPDGESKVFIGFLIISFLILVNFFFSLMVLCCNRPTSNTRQPKNDTAVEKTETEYVVKTEDNLHVHIRLIFIGFIIVYFMVIVNVETVMQNYLATFVIKYLKWSKAEGAHISSAFWGSFAVGRFLGIATAKILSPWRIIALDIFLLTAATLVLIFAVDVHDLVLWGFVCGSGLFISGLYAAGCSYVDEEIMDITGKVYPIFLVSETIGSMVYPVILGFLIDNVSAFWFVYLTGIFCLLCDVDFLCITLMVKKWGKKKRNQTASMEMHSAVD